ncbi:sal-like protein 3 [Lates japonicus]|uniref:Sal-like protein 3 n=1 Tax=Lates japonicus TaxID=270547 RepID=A0AAD3M5A0_LATJO|nr:sal-like protein 3 [Lates japonicus]
MPNTERPTLLAGCQKITSKLTSTRAREDIPERKSSSIARTDASSMSRRKQAKPQHLKSDEDPALAGGVISEHALPHTGVVSSLDFVLAAVLTPLL